MRDMFTLTPGDTRKFAFNFPELFHYEKDTYVIRLVYENRPSLLGGMPLGEDEPNALSLLRGSTPCRLVSNQLVVKVRP